MSRTDVQDTLREMWETRPARPRGDRQVAGVAAAIARRYDIDPVLVRVGFVVAAFSGIGAALYIAGWILLPEEPAVPGQVTQPKAPRNLVVIGLALAAALTIGTVFGGSGPDVVLPLLAVAALLYLLHRSRGHRAVAGTAATSTSAAGAAPAGTTGGAAASAPAGADALTVPTPAAAPPAWDPLGAAPFAWDLPEPSPVPPPPPPRRLPVTAVTLGLALLAGGITAVIMLLAGVLTLANLPVLLGVVLAVIGAGLLIGSFLRAGRGLIPFALLLSVLTWAAVAAPLDRWQGHGFGDLRDAPATVAQLQPSYHRTAGNVELDLRKLDLTATPGGNSSPVRTSVSVGAGDVEIWVPPNADVSFTGPAGVGDVEFAQNSQSGPGAHLEVTDDLGADGVASGRPLVLDVEMGAGNVEVHRG
jgi:phage shock protein PspC (stress-responsive transcriptional regulator)/predicted membrane protein